MSLMCEECKCTIGIDEGCDNGCECCNDANYVSESDQLRKVIKSITTKAQLALNKLDSAMNMFNDPCDGDSLEFAIGQVEHAITRLKSIEGVK